MPTILVQAIIVHTIPGVKNLITFLHQTLDNPVMPIILQASKSNNLISWPELKFTNVQKYVHHITATDKGHLMQHRKNFCLTQVQPEKLLPPLKHKKPLCMQLQTIFMAKYQQI